ncbi:DNA-binding transcriptional regulator ume6 [Rhizina undulata]
MQPKAPKTSTKTHRRSRTGCFTCRLRRKKCDEGKPVCKACKHLGLCCEYKRPVWWGNVDQRKKQKEAIKMLIKRTKLSEKVSQISPISADSPPELCRSLPTFDTLSDRRRSLSIESGYSLEYDLDAELELNPRIHHASIHAYHPFAPYEVDILTEKQTYVNNYPMPIRRASTSTASYTSAHVRSSSVGTMPGDAFIHVDPMSSHHHHPASLASTEDGVDFNLFDFGYTQPEVQLPYIPVEDSDRRLMDHFVENVLRLIYPILDLNLHGSARQDIIFPALSNNQCYRHCCLSISALHLKATQGLKGEWIDQNITRHRYATISGLCEALARDTDHLQILEATLGMILFQCSVGSPDDNLPDIPWHQHFQAATSLVHKLDLPRFLQTLSQPSHNAHSLNMTLTAWIDILGATMLGKAPQFADTYREKHLSHGLSGLRELMGCDDRVMYLISEIACLEALKNDNMLTDIGLCEHVKSLAHQIDLTEPSPENITPPIIQSGHVDVRALGLVMTAAFRFAARIYLCSLVPGFDRHQHQVKELLNKLTMCLEAIPAGPDGFDRSLVWVLLIGGSVATPGSMFRRFFQSRCEKLGEAAAFGSFGRMVRLLSEVWQQQDMGRTEVHWRDVMMKNNWDFLLV